jgi:hypothetical protein
MSNPNMPTDFLDAMERHWHDAQLLGSPGQLRLANSDHLYGIAAECGLKALMAKEGMDLENDGTHKKKYKKHINATWEHFSDFRQGKLATYALTSKNPFNDWLVDQRYAAEANFDAARVDKHRTGAKQVYDLVERAKDEGLLP